jgi:hypothetical protein
MQFRITSDTGSIGLHSKQTAGFAQPIGNGSVNALGDLDDNEGGDGRLQPKGRAKGPKSRLGGKYFLDAAIDSFLNRLLMGGLHDFSFTPYGIILRYFPTGSQILYRPKHSSHRAKLIHCQT